MKLSDYKFVNENGIVCVPETAVIDKVLELRNEKRSLDNINSIMHFRGTLATRWLTVLELHEKGSSISDISKTLVLSENTVTYLINNK